MILSNNTVKKCLSYAGKVLHAPEQKIILTATALATQPWIDLKNKDVDEATRKTSFARTIAKILAGAATGISIRYLGIWGAKALTKYKPILDKTGQFLTGVDAKRGILVPKFLVGQNAFKPMRLDKFDANMTRYVKAIGTLAATLTMVYTNFSCDAPWTKKLTPIVHNLFFGKEKNKEAKA